MDQDFPPSWVSLQCPWMRRDLLTTLNELCTDEPCRLWSNQREEGLVVGFDEVIHFFFDDHDFDERQIGGSFFDAGEVRLIDAVKAALNRICNDLPEGDDKQSVAHPQWEEVRRSSAIALALMQPR